MPISAELKHRVIALLEEAYREGVADGNAQTLHAIMNAARMNTVPATAGLAQEDQQSMASVATRAPRGRLKEVVTQILAERPGLTATEIGEIAPKIDDQVSSRSVGGELRRHEGRYYRKEGKRWFLIHQPPSPEAGGTTGAKTPAAGSAEDFI